MKKLLAILLLAGLGVLVTAVPALAAGAIQTSFDPTGDVFQCGATTYTITGGIVKETIHEGTSASGNQNITGTLVPQNVTLTDGTSSTVYRLVGADWFGGAINDQTG